MRGGVNDTTEQAQHGKSDDQHPKTGEFSDRIVTYPLRTIQGEHPLVSSIEGLLNLPPFPQPPEDYVPKAVVHALLQRMPVLVRREKDAKEREVIWCIGNARIFRLASSVLDPDDLVPTIEYLGSFSAPRRKQLQQGMLIERFLLPAIFGRRKMEMASLGRAWDVALKNEEKLLDFWQGIESFQRLYRRDQGCRGEKASHHG